MLPVAHFEVEAGDLGFLDAAVVVDEGGAEAVAQRPVGAQVEERLVERARQRLGLGLVGRVGRAWQYQLALDAVETAVDLRAEVEIRISRRLADAVLDARIRI